MFPFLLAYTEFFIVGLVMAIVLLSALLIRLEIRLRRLMSGKNAQSLEQEIATMQRRQAQLEQFKNEVDGKLLKIHNRISSSTRGISTLRFNAFDGRGDSGKQSFATAILSEEGDGVVISSMHAREHTRVYAKPLTQFSSEHGLTEEEKSVVESAKKQTEGVR